MFNMVINEDPTIECKVFPALSKHISSRFRGDILSTFWLIFMQFQFVIYYATNDVP